MDHPWDRLVHSDLRPNLLTARLVMGLLALAVRRAGMVAVCGMDDDLPDGTLKLNPGGGGLADRSACTQGRKIWPGQPPASAGYRRARTGNLCT
jgi:hypothetical protein